MRIAILGAGNGGLAGTVDLTGAGHQVALWNRSSGMIASIAARGGIDYRGVLGTGRVMPTAATTDLAEAIADADLVMVCLPSSALGSIARSLIAIGAAPVLLLNPGQGGGALEIAQLYREAGLTPPPIAELSTLTYVARTFDDAAVAISGVARRVWAAALPGGEAALAAASQVYPQAKLAPTVLTTALGNVNLVLHPPGAVLGAAWVEATGGAFTFYRDGMTPAVGRVLEMLDAERLAVGDAYGLRLPPLFDEMQAIGTIEPDADRAMGLAAAIRGGRANAAIAAPESLDHRYYREDIWYGLSPFLALADVAETPAPVASALFALGSRLAGETRAGRDAAAMGIAGWTKARLLTALMEGWE